MAVDNGSLYLKLKKEAEDTGYHFNPDSEFAGDLVTGLAVNEKRYGYRSCPCRLASGDRITDNDIICPCDYRDEDLAEYGACYCALYVTQSVVDGKIKTRSIPERRPTAEKREVKSPAHKPQSLSMPVWRCRVCGYLCARKEPPDSCPICKVNKDRFERFM